MSAEIFIKKILLDGGGIRFDLVGKNLPENFLGMAADLKFSNWSGDTKYEKMDWGNAFAGFAPEDLPVKMVKNNLDAANNQGEIIFGISLKADNLKTLRDGVVGSFYFSGKGADDLQFAGFQNNILSAYQNGRVDLTDVKWSDAGQLKMPTEIISSGASPIVQAVEPVKNLSTKEAIETVKNIKTKETLAVNQASVPVVLEASTQSATPANIYNIPDLDEAVQSDLTSSTVAGLRSMDLSPGTSAAQLADSQFFWWILPAVIGILILLLASWLYWRRRAGNRTWQYSPA